MTGEIIDCIDDISKGGIQIEYDDFNMRTKFTDRIKLMRSDDKPFFLTQLVFIPCWDYKPNNEYLSQKITNLSIVKKIHLKRDAIDGSVIESRGVQKEIFLFGFSRISL